MKSVALTVFLYTLMALGGAGTAHAQPDPLVLIVHPDNPVEDLSYQDVRRIARMDRLYWSQTDGIVLLLPGPSAVERRRTLDRVFLMSEQAFKQHWVSIAYQLEVLSLPRPYTECSVAVRIVGSLRFAASFVRASCVDDTVRVVRVDGKLPSDPGYRL
jgi:hypothetical protein